MKKYSFSTFDAWFFATFVLAPGWAQAGSGFYLSSDIGLNVASGIEYYRTQQRPCQRVR